MKPKEMQECKTEEDNKEGEKNIEIRTIAEGGSCWQVRGEINSSPERCANLG
jgi:hypothetical protein